MLLGIFGIEERDLDEGDVERVRFGIKRDFERSPDAVVETSAQAVSFDSSGSEGIYDFLSNDRAAGIRVGFFIVVGWKAVEAVLLVNEVRWKGPRTRRERTHK